MNGPAIRQTGAQRLARNQLFENLDVDTGTNLTGIIQQLVADHRPLIFVVVSQLFERVVTDIFRA